MIIRAIFVTFISLLLYSVFIYFMQSKIARTGQNQYSANVVKAEEFLFEKAHSEYLIVGSSMASYIVADSLSPGYFNLAMGGMSIFDGLYLIHRSSYKPKVVLIEINLVERSANNQMKEDLFHPILHPLSEYIPALRRKYQTVAVAKALLRDASGVKSDAAIFRLPEGMFKAELEKVMEKKRRRLSDIVIDRQFGKLSDYILELKKRGTKIVFFEMPFYEKAINLPRPVRIRTEFYKRFPETEYNFIKLPPDVYQTRDGAHLTNDEAMRYTHYLASQLSLVGL